MNVTQLNVDIAESIVPVLRKYGAITWSDIINTHMERTMTASVESMNELARQALEMTGDIRQINRWLRENGFPTATLVRLTYFKEHRHRADPEKKIKENNARILVACGGGLAAAPAGIVVDEPLLFNASREHVAKSLNGMAKSVISNVTEATAPGGHIKDPADVEGTVRALEGVRDTISGKAFAKTEKKVLAAANR